jgi:hypothetical protein
MPYKFYFDKIDAELLKISPRQDIMLLRVIAAVIPVALFGLLNPIVAALLHHFSSVFVVVNAGRLYFTGLEQSIIGPVFKKMDELTDRKRLCRDESTVADSETVVKQES